MQRIKWLEHKGKRIICGDYRELNSDEAMAQMKDSFVQMLAEEGTLLVLAEFYKLPISKEFMAYVKGPEPQRGAAKIDKLAVVGASAVQKILLNSFRVLNGIEAKVFSEREDALDWLVQSKPKRFRFFGRK